MREPLSIRVTTYVLLALFVFMVAVPLFWMVTTALKTNKDLYEDFTYLPRRPTLETRASRNVPIYLDGLGTVSASTTRIHDRGLRLPK